MPSEALIANASITGTTVRLAYRQVLGDMPVTDSDGKSVYEWLVSEMLLAELERLEGYGIRRAKITANVLTFAFLEGLDVLELIAHAASVVVEAHGKTPLVFLPQS